MLGGMKYGKLNVFVWVIGPGVLALVLGAGVNFYSRVADIEIALGGRERIACNRYNVINEVSPAVVRIIGGVSEGSGFSYAEKRILTNYHVVRSEPSPKVVFSDGSVENGHVVAVDASRDLAIIQVAKETDWLSWLDEEYRTGEEVLALGFPYGGYVDGEVTANQTTVSGFRYDRSTNTSYAQVSGGIIEGMSGGPLIDMCGRVVGVNVKGADSAFGLAVSARTAQEFIG